MGVLFVRNTLSNNKHVIFGVQNDIVTEAWLAAVYMDHFKSSH